MIHVRFKLASAFFGAIFALASLSVASFSDVAFAAAPKAGKMTATLHALHDALNGRDKDKIVALYADDATIEDPAGSPLKEGKEAIDRFYGNAVQRGITMDIVKIDELPDRQCKMDARIHVGDKVVNTQETYSFKPDGKIASMKSTPAAKN